MRLPSRFSIAGLMAVVLVSSFGLAALHSGSATWAGGLYLLTHGVLALAVVGAAYRGASERAWWLGFALFGFGYLRRAFGYGYGTLKLPTTVLLDIIRPDAVTPYGDMFGTQFDGPIGYYWVVGHCLWSLLAATIGGGLAHALFAAPAGPSAEREAEAGQERRPVRAGWRRLAVVGLAGLVTFAALVLVGPRSDPAL